MSSFVGLTPEICGVARYMIYPSVDWAMEHGVFKRPEGHLVVLNPRVPYEPKYHHAMEHRFLEDVVLYHHAWGDPSSWETNFRSIAWSKAFTSWKTGLPSRAVQQLHPYLYEEGWAKFGGSVVFPGGLVVAFSGVQQWFDEMISGWMACAIQALCLDEMHRPDGVLADESITFLGE